LHLEKLMVAYSSYLSVTSCLLTAQVSLAALLLACSSSCLPTPFS
jgi:hypothetical protein